VGLLCLGAYILYEEIFTLNLWARIKKTPSILIPVAWTLLSLPSLFFNLEKLGESGKKSKIYKFTRIFDLIFSIYMIPLIIIGISRFIFMALGEEGGDRLHIDDMYLPVLIMVACLVASILLFIDNIKFHKSFRHVPVEETFDDIGK
jgi:hypothetical protein